MSFLDTILEDGKATEATLQRLIGIFGPLGGEIVHELVQAVKTAQAPAPAAPVEVPQDAKDSASG